LEAENRLEEKSLRDKGEHSTGEKRSLNDRHMRRKTEYPILETKKILKKEKKKARGRKFHGEKEGRK